VHPDSKAAKRRCSGSTASFDNTVGRDAQRDLSFNFNPLGASGMARLGVVAVAAVAALAKEITLPGKRRLDSRHS